jgi:hypothetical protein
MQVWKSMLETARADGIDMTKPLRSDQVLVLRDAPEGVPAGLSAAILDAFSTRESGSNEVSIGCEKLVRWTGINKLDATASKQAITLSSFRQAWKESLPEQWRDSIDLALVSDRHTLNDGSKTIKFKDYGGGPAVTSGSKGTAENQAVKRKWHEKFRPSKKA